MKRAILFSVCVLTLALHQYAEKILCISIPLLDNYLDPFLLMPILLSLVAWERKLLWNKMNELSTKEIFGYFIIVSLLSELVFPALKAEFTGDWRDVLLYLAGSMIYLHWMNRPQLKNNDQQPLFADK